MQLISSVFGDNSKLAKTVKPNQESSVETHVNGIKELAVESVVNITKRKKTIEIRKFAGQAVR